MDVLLSTPEVRVMTFSLLSIFGFLFLVSAIKTVRQWGKALKVAVHVRSPMSASA
jgi:hypothetical protein